MFGYFEGRFSLTQTLLIQLAKSKKGFRTPILGTTEMFGEMCRYTPVIYIYI